MGEEPGTIIEVALAAIAKAKAKGKEFNEPIQDSTRQKE